MSTAIAIEGVTKRFGSVFAVDGLDLRAPRGSLYGFIGPNGSGKSTTPTHDPAHLAARSGRGRGPGPARYPGGARPGQLPPRGTRVLQANERAEVAALLRFAEGGTPARARPIDRQVAGEDGVVRLDRQEDRRPVLRHGPEGPVRGDGTQPSRSTHPRPVRVDDGQAAGQCGYRDGAGRAPRRGRFRRRGLLRLRQCHLPGADRRAGPVSLPRDLLYGSLYTAVGAACSEVKDAQSLMMPVMLLSMIPVFVWTAVLKNPASPLSVGMSLFPPASPFLMLMRLALRPAPPAWQVALSVVLTTLTAMAIVGAAGKVFRTGLLMQGKPPSFVELARWVKAK